MQAMIMTVPPTNDTKESILATRPRRTAPSRFPCSRLFLDWRKGNKTAVSCSFNKRSWKSHQVPRSYHDGVDESDDVDRPDGAEAGQHGQEEVVFDLWPIQWGVCRNAGMPRNWGPGREGRVADGARPAALPRFAGMMGVGDGVLSSGRGGDDWRGAVCRCGMDPVTCTWRMTRTTRKINACVHVCTPRSPFMQWDLTFPKQADEAVMWPNLHPPAASVWGQTYRSLVSRWWQWLALLWICCAQVLCLLLCCCEGVLRPCQGGSGPWRGLESCPDPGRKVVPRQTRRVQLESCSQPSLKAKLVSFVQ